MSNSTDGTEMTFPTPTGASIGIPLANPQINPNSSIADVEAYINSIGENGAAYAAYARAAIAKDPKLTPVQAWEIWVVGGGIASGLGTATTATGNFVQQSASGVTKGAQQIYNDIIGRFNIGSWFLRIGEILLGLVLIGVGVARITGAQNVISKLAKVKI